MNGRFLRLVTGAALCFGLGLGCKRAEPVTGPPDGSKPIAIGASQPDVKPLAKVDNPEQLLPADAQFVLVGKSPNRAAKIFDRNKVAEKFPEAYAKASRDIVRVFGVDLLDPNNLPTIGIDPAGRGGVALLDVRHQAFALFATLTDVGKFRQAVLDTAGWAGQQVRPTSLGGAEILQDKSGRVAVVIRAPFAYLVVVDRLSEASEPPAYARTIATMDPNNSLAATTGFRRATGGMSGGDALGFINVAGMVESQMGRMGEFGPKDDQAWRKRIEAQQELARQVFGSFGAVGFSADAKRQGSVVEMRAFMADDDLARQLFRNGKGAPPLSWAVLGRPMLLLETNIELEPAQELLSLALKAEGTTYGEANNRVKTEFGVDFDKELKPLLTGSGGFVVTFEGDMSSIGSKKLLKQIGFAARVEVSDPGKAAKLLDKAAAAFEVDGRKFAKHAKSGGYVLEIPDWRPLYAALGGKHFVVSTDPNLGKRIAKGKGGSIERLTKPRGAHAVMSLKGSAVTYAHDMTLFGWLLFGTSGMIKASSSVESVADAKIPKSRNWKRQKKQVDKLRKAVEEAQRKRERAEADRAADMIEPLGIMALSVKEDDAGLVGQGGWFVRTKGLAGLAQHVAKLAQGQSLERKPEDEEFFRLQSQLSEVEAELQRIRQEDIARIRSRKGKR